MCKSISNYIPILGLNVDGVELATPPEDQELAQKFSSMWIIVEQAIANIKDWAATCETLHLPLIKTHNLYEYHHCVWTVVSVLVNESWCLA